MRPGAEKAVVSQPLVATRYVVLLLRTTQINNFILFCSPAEERVNIHALHSFVVCTVDDRPAGTFGLCFHFLEQYDLRAAPNVHPRSRGFEYGQRQGGSGLLLTLRPFGTCWQA
ncbi:hypothetical protein D3C72_1629990 [compost metagenome]